MTNVVRDFGIEAIPERTARIVNVLAPLEQDEEIFRIQADGFGETEGGFQDVELIWRQRQQQN